MIAATVPVEEAAVPVSPRSVFEVVTIDDDDVEVAVSEAVESSLAAPVEVSTNRGQVVKYRRLGNGRRVRKCITYVLNYYMF